MPTTSRFRTESIDIRYFRDDTAPIIISPLGTPFILSPFVRIANTFGYNALSPGADEKGQRAVDYCVILLLLYTLFGLVRRTASFSRFSEEFPILLMTGTLIGPTVATGLWSINFEILLMTAGALIIRSPSKSAAYDLALGCLEFLGFMVRPTFALFILAAFAIQLAKREWRRLFVSASSSATLFLLFAAWSHRHYGTWLPPYYLASRMSLENAREAFFGLLVSPSRSIFLYSPILVVTLWRAITEAYAHSRRQKEDAEIWLWATLAVCLFLSNVFFPHWTGGWSFGPRILSDLTLTGFIFLLSCDNKNFKHHTAQDTWRKWALAALLIGTPVSMSGIYNRYALFWNEFPNIDYNTEIVWDWRYPQPLMTRNILARKCLTQSAELGLKTSACSK